MMMVCLIVSVSLPRGVLWDGTNNSTPWDHTLLVAKGTKHRQQVAVAPAIQG